MPVPCQQSVDNSMIIVVNLFKQQKCKLCLIGVQVIWEAAVYPPPDYAVYSNPLLAYFYPSSPSVIAAWVASVTVGHIWEHACDKRGRDFLDLQPSNVKAHQDFSWLLLKASLTVKQSIRKPVKSEMELNTQTGNPVKTALFLFLCWRYLGLLHSEIIFH